MQKTVCQETLNDLSDGHSFFTLDHVRKIVTEVGVPFPHHLVQIYRGQKEAAKVGLYLNADGPCEGVPSSSLSNYVIRQLGIDAPHYLGRGSQSRANAKALVEFLRRKNGSDND